MKKILVRNFIVGTLIGVLVTGVFILQADDCDGTTGNDAIACTTTSVITDNSASGDLGNDTITIDAGVNLAGYVAGDGQGGTDNAGSGPGGDDTITNNGTVAGFVNGDWSDGNGGNDTITNNGTVNGINGDGSPNAGITGGNDTITNNGTVTTTVYGDGFIATGGNDTITNNGQIGGDIIAGGGTDTVIVGSTGDVVGNIDAGTEDDTVTMNDGAMVGGTIDGGAGTDTLSFQFSDPAEGAAAALALAAMSPAGGTITFGGQTYTWTNFEQLRALYTIAVQSGATDIKISIARIGDGRLNAYDLGAPVAVYCVAGESIEIIDIGNNGVNAQAFKVSMSDVNTAVAQAKATFDNVFIAGNLDDMLLAKLDGSVVVVGPSLGGEKLYTFTFQPDCGVKSIGAES